jgi:hypothetical protein
VSTDTPELEVSDEELNDEVVKALQRHGERDMKFSEKARRIVEEVQE